MGLLERNSEKQNNWFSVDSTLSQMKKKDFVKIFKEFFNINNNDITRSDLLYLHLKKLFKYNTSEIILNFLHNLETFKESFDVSQKRIEHYLDSVEKMLEGFLKKNEGQSVKNLHFRKLEKRYIKKLGLEIISII